MNHEQPVNSSQSPSQPEIVEPSAAGNDWNNGISRRRFLKTTGGATVATMIAWNASSIYASAEEGQGGGSSKNLWWEIQKTTGAAKTILLTGVANLSDTAVFEKAVSQLFESGSTAPLDPPENYKATGGTKIEPKPLVSAVSGQGTATLSRVVGGGAQVDFPADYKVKVTYLQ